MRQKKKQIILFVCVVVAAVLLIGFILFLGKEEIFPTKYKENTQSDVIEHCGRKYRYNEHLSNYLFMGIDTREAIEEYETRGNAGQADTIFLLSYDRVKKTIKGLSIPRDTMASIHVLALDGADLGYAKNHINLQYAFGDGKTESCNLMTDAVENLLYGIPIQWYCSINMDGIPIIADLAGGVELTVPDDSLQDVRAEFKQGAQVTITKENAEIFLRHRDTEERQSAIARMNRQKVFMEALAQAISERSSKDTSFIIDVYEELEPYMVTNIKNDDFLKIMQGQHGSEQVFQDIPGEKVDGTDYDEYHVNEEELRELVLQMFYEEVQDE